MICGAGAVKQEVLDLRHKPTRVFRCEPFELGTVHRQSKIFETRSAKLLDEPVKQHESVG